MNNYAKIVKLPANSNIGAFSKISKPFAFQYWFTGERFNARTNSWEPIASMHSRRFLLLKGHHDSGTVDFIVHFLCFRATHEVVQIDHQLYALGGNDGSSSLNTVEKYDSQANKWSIVIPMVTRRSSVGGAVLECLNLERGLVQSSNLWYRQPIHYIDSQIS